MPGAAETCKDTLLSKVLKAAAVVVGAVALAATGIGLAVGAGTVIASGITIGTIATVASVTASVLSLAVALTAKKPTAQATGSPTQFSADPDAGIPLVLGRTGTAGNIVMRTAWDTRDAGDNDRQAFVAVHSLGPIAGYDGFTVDKSPVNFSAGAALGTFAGFMWMVTQLGATPEASALSFGNGAGSPPGWTAAHKLSGKAAATWTLRFDTNGKKYQAGVPAPMWVVRGAKCYDPRKDSTYPGGGGSHRMADPSDTAAYDAAMDTWEFTEDPYLLSLRWAHGFWQRDRSDPSSKYQRVMGIGAPWALIDVPAFVEGANISAANGWKAGGIIYSGDDKWASMKKLLQAGMGEPLALGARISCLVNAPKVSLATIGKDDLAGKASVAATQPRRNRINTITPRYRLEDNNWQLLPGPPIGVPEYVVLDKGKRSKTQDYPFIQNTKQVATAARYDIENAREFGPITLPLKLVWMGYKPGDCVTVTLPEVGLNSQQVLLLNRDLDPATGVVTMSARSETAAKHPYALGQTTTPPPTPGVTGPLLVPTPGLTDWSLSVLPAADNARVPTLLVTGAVKPNVDSVLFEYRVFGSGAAWSTAGSDVPSVTRREIAGVIAGTQYEVAVSYARNGVAGDRRIIGPVATPGQVTNVDWGNVSGKPITRLFDNMLDMTPWKVGAVDTFGRFSANGIIGTNRVFLGNGPGGVSEPVLMAVAQQTNNAAGGWNYTATAADGFDPQRTYRLMTWVYFEPGSNGTRTLYLGSQSDKGALLNTAGNANSNPYFWLLGTSGLLPNKWYLAVGIVHGASYAGGESGISGLYDPVTGQRVTAGSDFKSYPDQTTLVHRAYQYYAQTLGDTAYFARPSIEEMTTSSLSVQQIFATVGMTASEKTAFANAQSLINAMASDGVIVAGAEKRELARQVDQAMRAYNRAHDTSGSLATTYGGDPTYSQRVVADNAWSALAAYLNSLSPAWTNTSLDTPVDAATLNQKFADLFVAIATLDTANDAYDQARAKAALDQITAIGSDNVLSRGEKSTVIVDWQSAYNDWQALASRYHALGDPADLWSAMSNANNNMNALAAYLTSLSPSWSDVSQDSPIDGTTWRQKWTDGLSSVAQLRAAYGAYVGLGSIDYSKLKPDSAVDLGSVVPGALNTANSASQSGSINLPVTLNAPNTSGPNGDGTQAIVVSPGMWINSSGDSVFVDGSVTSVTTTMRGNIVLQKSTNGTAWSDVKQITAITNQATFAGTYPFSYEDISHSAGWLYFRLLARQNAAQGTGDGTAGTNWTIANGSIRVRRFFAK